MSEPGAVQISAPTVPAATARLEASREQLRLSLRRSAGLDRPAGAPASAPGWAGNVVAVVRAVPGAEPVLDAVGHWWANHPMRTAVRVAGEAARGVAAPLARQQPLAMMLGALLAGALVAKLRPWRWLPRTLMFAGLLPQIASRLVASVPIESWLSALLNAPPKDSGKARLR